jgi:hypothetical protein
MTNQTETFGDALLTGIARLSIKTLTDGRFAVVRYLPCGMDIAPEVYERFDTLTEAQACFNSKRSAVAALMGVYGY